MRSLESLASSICVEFWRPFSLGHRIDFILIVAVTRMPVVADTRIPLVVSTIVTEVETSVGQDAREITNGTGSSGSGIVPRGGSRPEAPALGRETSVDERKPNRVGAFALDAPSRVPTYPVPLHAARSNIGDRGFADRTHEASPDLQCPVRTAQVHRPVVVAADPDHRNSFRTVAGEPTVAQTVGRPGLAREHLATSQQFPGSASGSFAQHPAQGVRDEKHRVAVRNAGRALGIAGEGAAFTSMGESSRVPSSIAG